MLVKTVDSLPVISRLFAGCAFVCSGASGWFGDGRASVPHDGSWAANAGADCSIKIHDYTCTSSQSMWVVTMKTVQY